VTLIEEAAHAPESLKLGALEKANNLVELFAPVRGPLTDEEIDHLFKPQSLDRPSGRSVTERRLPDDANIPSETLRRLPDARVAACMLDSVSPTG
jgi:hypothetical protein